MSPRHRYVTYALWVGLFMNLMTVYFLNSWLPIIIKYDGFSMAGAALMGAMMQIGGTLGNFAIGWEMDRFKPHRAMMGTLLGAAVLTVTLGSYDVGYYELMVLVFLLGFCVNASNTGWTAMAAGYYSTEMRATGTSWMTSIGRFRAISGAYIGSVLLGLKWDLRQLFLILTIPIGIAMLAAYVKGRSSGPGSPQRQGGLKRPVEPL
jgi:AAHS family 4-hydroxybenzoate transporter-like MFS transporter